MSFSSVGFIAFAAVLLLFYYLVPKKIRWILLLLGSLFFYAFAGLYSFALLCGVTAVTYLFSLGIGKRQEKEKAYFLLNADLLSREEKKAYRAKEKKKNFRLLLVGLCLNIGVLAVVKYTAFVLGGVNSVFGTSFTYPSMLIPMGLSFYVFQSTAYLIDVYRGTVICEKNPFRFALFISFFPQLVQGPIARWNDLQDSLFEPKPFCAENLMAGGIRFAWGFFKKLVIADRLLPAVKEICAESGVFGGGYVFALIILYSIVIYADFTGGMDIAIGYAKMLGITLTENFNRPFSSHSLKEYWRRWHITMGTWFADYIFYPLSVSSPMQKLSSWGRKHLGNAVGKRLPVYIATLVTWFLTGLWHGAGWNFIVWGVLNGVLILLSQELSPLYAKFQKRFPGLVTSAPYRAFTQVRTFLIVGTIRILDVYGDVGLTFTMLGRMFVAKTDLSAQAVADLGLTAADAVIVLLGVVAMAGVSRYARYLEEKNEKRRVSEVIASHPLAFGSLAVCLILIVLIFGVYGFGYDASQFIYRQF